METNEYLTQMKMQVAVYVSLGWSVIPLKWRDKVPDNRVLPTIVNKEGRRVASWQQYQTRTPIQWELKTWFGHVRNVGIVTGILSKIVVVDCDNDAARDWLYERSLVPEYTPTVKTRKGWHFYFTYPAGEYIGNRVGMHHTPGLDLRAEGGQVVAPPSVHSEGHQYHWLVKPGGLLPTLPAWFFVEEKKAAGTSGETLPPASGSHNSSQKMTYYERMYADRLERLRRTAYNRNNELNRTAFILGQILGLKKSPRTRSQVESDLWSIALAIGLEEKEIGKTIASGLNAGECDYDTLEAYRVNQQRQWIARQQGKR